MNQIDNDHQGKLSIREVASATGISRSTLRHWEREFRDFLKSAVVEGEERRFAPDAIEKIDRIKSLVEEQGLTLRGARLQLDRTDSNPVAGPDPPADAPLEQKARTLADKVTDRLLSRIFQE